MAYPRKLVALMFTDIAGYSKMTQKNELSTHELLTEHQKLVRNCIAEHEGKEIRTVGDGFFIEFSSAVSALECAAQIQQRLHQLNHSLPTESRLRLRIGIHLGDVLVSGDETYGNEVSVAARIQSLAPEGGICTSESVYTQIKDKVSYKFQRMGSFTMKNINGKSTLYQIELPWEKSRTQEKPDAKKAIRNYFTTTSISALLIGGIIASTGGFTSLKWLQSIKDEMLPSVFLAQERGPAGTAIPFSLEEGWEILTQPRSHQNWIPYDPRGRMSWIDQIHGEYWLRKKFTIPSEYQEPAMILGVIPNRHRVYVDGKLIGGSDSDEPIEIYTMDKTALQLGVTHTLLVKAYSQGTLLPGIESIKGVGSWLGEFSQLSPKLRRDLIYFHLPRVGCFAISLLFLAAITLFSALNYQRRDYFYLAVYSALAVLSSFYQNHLLSDSLPYTLQNWLRLFSVGLMSPALASATFVRRGQKSFETINNTLILAFAVASVLWVAIPEASVSNTLQVTNIFYLVALGYALWSMSLGGFTSVLSLMHGVFCLFSIRGPWMPAELSQFKFVVSQLFVAQPIIFAAGLIFYFLKMYSTRSKRILKQEKGDALIQDMINSKKNLSKLHQDVIQSLNCLISGIYTVHGGKFTSISYEPKTLQHPLESTPTPIHPILTMALHQKRAIRMDEIPVDVATLMNEERTKFETGACMVIPVWTGQSITAIVTFADPVGRGHFDDIDFNTAQMAAQILVQRIPTGKTHAHPHKKTA